MQKYIILLIISTLFLSSCGNGDENLNTNDTKQPGVVGINEDVGANEKKLDIKYDKNEEKLSIGNNVVITPGLPDLFPKEITIYKNNKTYVNSNVKDYLFFVTDKTTTSINDISLHYTSLFENLGYKRINNEIINDANIEDNSIKTNETLEFVIENTDSNSVSKYKQRVIIYINSEVPENIKNSMGLQGNFVEIYYNQINN